MSVTFDADTLFRLVMGGVGSICFMGMIGPLLIDWAFKKLIRDDADD